MTTYSKGCTDCAMVRLIQQALNIPVDGIFGQSTFVAVTRYQGNHNLVADGVVGPQTLVLLGILDTDLKSAVSVSNSGLVIEKHHMPKEQYVTLVDGTPIKNDYVFLHHTAGWDNPINVIDDWARDDRGTIATEFVIGGQNIKTCDHSFDGRILQAFPTGAQAWHLGNTGSTYMNKHSVGIELCNFGQLTEDLKTYSNTIANPLQVIRLKESFNGYFNWHKYSTDQLNALRKLLIFIGERDYIDVHRGLIEWIHKDGPTKAFGFRPEAFNGEIKGLLTHANVRKDKVDVSPQPDLIDMLLTL